MSTTPPKNIDIASSPDLKPPPRQTRSDFDLEPNPFEQSFSRPSNVRHTSRSRRDSLSPASNKSSKSHNDRPTSAASNAHSNEGRSTSPRPVLPPLAAIASPNTDQSYGWQFSSSLASLRAGPLSPAMLAGPQQGSDSASHLPFESSFRTGLTPRGLTPRLGLTPGSGLTPLVGGPVSFPPPSPSTAAFLALMNNGAGANLNATITPNTLNAITVLGSSSAQYSSVTHAPTTSSHLSTSITANQENSDTPYLSASNAASTAANGLYLLSQAHQELTKREEAQARANSAASAPVNGRRGTKRKSYDPASPPPQPASTARTAAPQQQIVPTKRARANTINSVSTNGRGTADEDEEEEDDDDDEQHPTQGTGGRKQKKPETEEEKRRNFLERNRQAALKCRQRKKAWLASLQAKVEYLQTENERLTSALVSSREEISRLSALVGGAVIGPGGPVGSGVVPPPGAVNGVTTNGQPVSMNMNLVVKGTQATTSGRATYGY